MTFNEIAAIIKSANSEKLREIIEAGRVSDINKQNNEKSDNPIVSVWMWGTGVCKSVIRSQR